jgi:Transglycosylase SLT domain
MLVIGGVQFPKWIEHMSSGKKIQMRLLALAITLDASAAVLPAEAQISEATTTSESGTSSETSAAVFSAGPVQTDASQFLAKPTDWQSLCQAIASAAALNQLPIEFFSRIIWQESRFNAGAIGPLTRGGQRAQGIAQFMPATASERSLRNPFDPFEALPKSAEFLRELQAQFGNLGLAAAAYNAGPQRTRDWLDGKKTLPQETQAYVQKVTGHSAQEWRVATPTVLAVAMPVAMSCAESVWLMQKQQPSIASSPSRPLWVAQLIGDSSETAALSRFRQMQGKLRAALGNYEPAILRTTIKASAAPIWIRLRIEFDTRRAAEALCSRLEAAGEPCLVQRNFDNAPLPRKTAATQPK